MIAVQLTRAFEVRADGVFEDHIDHLMNELLALESETIRDADVSGSLGRVEVSVYSIGATFDKAAELGDAAIRAAIHASGGHTPDWVPVTTVVNAAELTTV